jgi:predicted nucleic acid-binding protein
MKGIADTGFLVDYLNSKDRNHGWAMEVEAAITEPLFTCEAVLTEAAYLLRNVVTVMQLVSSGFVRVEFALAAHDAELTTLARQFRDQEPDRCDLCIVRMSELFPDRTVITTDRRDFTIYRRNQRELIPLVLPPE